MTGNEAETEKANSGVRSRETSRVDDQGASKEGTDITEQVKHEEMVKLEVVTILQRDKVGWNTIDKNNCIVNSDNIRME